MSISRRSLVVIILALIAPQLSAHPGRHRHPHRIKKRLRKPRIVRRRVIRRRVRRRVLWRTVRGRRVLVTPLALAIGWELMLDNKVVIVKTVHVDKIIVEHENGDTEEVDIVREDTSENSKELEGSEYEEIIEEEVEE